MDQRWQKGVPEQQMSVKKNVSILLIFRPYSYGEYPQLALHFHVSLNIGVPKKNTVF